MNLQNFRHTVIHALIVDNFALIRKLLSAILNEDPNFRVIRKAVNGKNVLEKIEKLRSDVVKVEI